MIALAAIVGLSLAWLLQEIITAPEGWEGEDGFRYGPEPVDHDSRKGADRLRPVGSITPFHSSLTSPGASRNHG